MDGVIRISKLFVKLSGFVITFLLKISSFRKNFNDGWEEEGASVAVYHKGKLVVDIWGGFAERKYNRPWRQNTLACIFSCTKVSHCFIRSMIKFTSEYRKHLHGYAS